jgi:hypothetical protein
MVIQALVNSRLTSRTHLPPETDRQLTSKGFTSAQTEAMINRLSLEMRLYRRYPCRQR